MTKLPAILEDFNAEWMRLVNTWESTKHHWDDKARETLESSYWQILEAEVKATQREMEHLAQVVLQSAQELD